MAKNTFWKYGVILVFVGILIGLVISANFDFTRRGEAIYPTQGENQNQRTPSQSSRAALTIEDLSNAFADVADQVNPSVVTIFTETIVEQRRSPFFQFPFEQFFGEDFNRFFQNPQNRDRKQKTYGLGSGVIVSENGVIITNNHVIDGADNIKVRLMDNKEYDAEIKGVDPRSDLAVLEIDVKNLPIIRFGNSETSRVGEWVLAIGSPLSPELAHSVTSGIISAKGRSGLFDNRQYVDFIQTDAAINPGNSGGALVNIRGELIGINTAIASRNGGFMGIGFAIPSNLAKKVMDDILQKGKVVRGWLGVYIQDVTMELATAMDLKNNSGVLVSSVQDNSPAEKAGLKTEDVIIRFNGKEVKNSTELRNLVANSDPGEKVKLQVIRSGKEKEVDVVLGELPEDNAIAAKNNPAISEDIGIKVANINQELSQKFNLESDKGVVITEVSSGSIAEQSGLRPGDIILRINRKTVNNISVYNEIMKDTKTGDSFLFYVQRGDAKIFIAFSLPEK
jgi:serine protease Do